MLETKPDLPMKYIIKQGCMHGFIFMHFHPFAFAQREYNLLAIHSTVSDIHLECNLSMHDESCV